MNEAKILDVVLREIQAVGQAWRLDWNDFDGRTLRSQMEAIASWAARARANPGTPEYTEESDALKEMKEQW